MATISKLESKARVVGEFIRANPRCTRNDIVGAVVGGNAQLAGAVNHLLATGKVTERNRKLTWTADMEMIR